MAIMANLKTGKKHDKLVRCIPAFELDCMESYTSDDLIDMTIRQLESSKEKIAKNPENNEEVRSCTAIVSILMQVLRRTNIYCALPRN